MGLICTVQQKGQAGFNINNNQALCLGKPQAHALQKQESLQEGNLISL